MVNRLPAEVLDIVLSFIASSDPPPEPEEALDRDNIVFQDERLDSLSATSTQLREHILNFRLSKLKTELEKISSLDLLSEVWEPFFILKSDSTSSASEGSRSKPELHELVLNRQVCRDAQEYIRELQSRDRVATELAHLLCQYPDLQVPQTEEPREDFVKTIVLKIWAAEVYRGHDTEFVWNVTDEDGRAMLRDEIFQHMNDIEREGSVAVYRVMTTRLLGPFSTRSGNIIQAMGPDNAVIPEYDCDMHVYRIVVKDGMEEVLRLLRESDLGL